MSRTTRRVLRTELLRGTAPVAAVAVAAAGAVLLLAEPQAWAGRWAPLAEQMRVLLMVLGPLAVTAGTWQVGRERRRRIGGLLLTTARPPWQRTTLVWGAVTVGTFAGYLVAWLVGAAFVAPVATYAGRGWWWTLLGGLAGLAALSALGVVIGRLVPVRFVAPLAGSAVFVALFLVYGNASPVAGHIWLLPSLGTSTNGTQHLDTGFHLQQTLWFAAVTATLLMLISVRRIWLAAIPALVAVSVAVPMVTAPVSSRWHDDPAARELVCADVNGIDICLTKVNAFLLDEATATVAQPLTLWKRFADIPSRIVDGPVELMGDGSASRASAMALSFSFIQFVTLTGGMSDRGVGWTFNAEVDYAVTDMSCDAEASASLPDTAWEASDLAHEWARSERGDDHPAASEDGVVDVTSEWLDAERLLALPAAQQEAWIGRYLAAARTCDADALVGLVEELA